MCRHWYTHFGLLRLTGYTYKIRRCPGPHASEGLKIKRKEMEGSSLETSSSVTSGPSVGSRKREREKNKNKIVCVCHTSSTCNKHRGFSWVRLSSRNPYYYYQMLDDSLREPP